MFTQRAQSTEKFAVIQVRWVFSWTTGEWYCIDNANFVNKNINCYTQNSFQTINIDSGKSIFCEELFFKLRQVTQNIHDVYVWHWNTENKYIICYRLLTAAREVVIFCSGIIRFILINALFQFQVCGITGRSYTYSRLRDHSAALAIRLQKKLNLQIGDVIAVCLPNIPEFPIAALGAIEAGLILTTINPIYTAGKPCVYFIIMFTWNKNERKILSNFELN